MLVASYVETFDFSHFHRNMHKLNILDIWILGIFFVQFLSFYFDWPLMQKGEGKWSCNCNAGSFFESISKRTIWVNYLRILFPQKSPFGTHHINEHICVITDNWWLIMQRMVARIKRWCFTGRAPSDVCLNPPDSVIQWRYTCSPSPSPALSIFIYAPKYLLLPTKYQL